MFITTPIKSFELNGNKIKVNESVIEYEDISEDTKEILESLISKGAYGSALLTLNMFYNVKSINESDYTQEEYEKYLGECNKLMEVCVSETEAHNFRPLVNLNGLEIMENENYIARGKGNKLLIEDFRNQKILKEEASPWMKYQTQVEQMFENAKSELDENMFLDFCNMVGTMAKDYEFGYNEDDEDDEDMYESVDERHTGNSKADEVVFDFSQTERDTETFTKALNEISRMEYDNEIDKDKYNECIKKIQDLFTHKDKSIDDLKECEGTQCSDIAEKKDQEVGSLQKPKKPKKHFVEMFKVPRNHGFKGFRLNENGYYTRGNYILINENNSIKAVRANIINDYGTHVWDYNQVETEQAPRLVADLNNYFNEGYDIYDFGFRIEDSQLKVYDANEEFDFSYLDDKYEKANKILQDLFGKDAYFEAELAPIGVVAGIEIRDLN